MSRAVTPTQRLSRRAGCPKTSRRCLLNEMNSAVRSRCLATGIARTSCASSRVGAPQKAGKRRAMRAASCVWPTPWRLATPKAIRSHRS